MKALFDCPLAGTRRNNIVDREESAYTRCNPNPRRFFHSCRNNIVDREESAYTRCNPNPRRFFHSCHKNTIRRWEISMNSSTHPSYKSLITYSSQSKGSASIFLHSCDRHLGWSDTQQGENTIKTKPNLPPVTRSGGSLICAHKHRTWVVAPPIRKSDSNIKQKQTLA
jgi:hypothetical protein